MAQRGEDITTRFKVDVSDLKAGISEANKQIKLANAEFKAASAGMDDWTKSSDGLNAKLKQLDTVLGNENKKLQSYKDQLQKIEEASQENGKRADELKTKLQQLSSQGVSKTSAEYQKYEKALNDVEKEQIANQNAADKLRITILNQQGTVNKTEKEIRQYTTALNDLESESDQVGNATEDLNKDLKDTNSATSEADGGFTILKGTLANLTANVISSAISKIGELASSLFDMVEATEEYRSMMAKLEGATNNYGYQIDYTKDKFEEFYRYLGDSQMANNAISNLMGLQVETGTLDKLVNGAISTWSMYGDSIPIESLTESINETIQVGKVTGTFADTLNWTKVNQEQLSASLGNGSAAQRAFNQAISEGESVEDAFSAALAATSDQGERANIVAGFLNSTYGESKTTYDELNGAMLNANQSELDLIDSQAKLAEVVSPVKDVFTQLKTQALDAILPVVTGLAQKFFDLKVYLEEHPTVLKIVTAAITALATAFGVLAGALAIQALISGVTKAFALLNTTLLANPIVLIVAAIAGLVAAFITLWNTSEEFRNFWIGLWEGIKNTCQVAINAVVEFFTTAWDNIKNAWSGVTEFFSGIWEGIKNVFSDIGEWFSEKFTAAKDGIKNAWADTKEWASEKWNGIKESFSNTAKWFGEQFTKAKENRNSAWADTKEWASNTWNGIKEKFGSVGSWFKSTFQSAWTNIKNVFSSWGSFFSGLWNKIKNTFTGMGTKIGDAIGGSVKTAINGVISKIESIINKAIGLINGAIGVINKLPGVNVGKIGRLNLPRLAQGGILKKGQVGLLEGSGDEAVVPLHNNKKWIKAVADDMRQELQSGVGSTISNLATNNVNNFTQIINAPKQPSRIEIYRDTKNLLALKGGV